MYISSISNSQSWVLHLPKEEDVSDPVDVTFAKHGKLDIMYNNAGVMDKFACPIVDTALSGLDRYGMLGLAGNLAAQLGEFGIRVNCVAPYAVKGTGIANRLSDPEIMDPKVMEQLAV
ncbi:hypothetical protein MLD38_038494 [Melastoma candidum]|uniref:Uncharacterized protein n=1 Tax=Melastoma candidum TaxID=119954 RepID=A0ACB9KZB8_9MYRT|nr:hypothetical protein MLD38_038494 [Melastoma candidum]